MNKPICPFCGTDKLKFFARIAGGYNRHYIGQFHCLKCGARSPHVNSRKMDYREHLTQAEEMELQVKALQAFQPRKEEKGGVVMSNLKPCLCGSDKVHFGYEPFCGLTFWRVMCDTCGTETSTFDTKEEAAKVWNTRPAEDAKDKEIERLKSDLAIQKNLTNQACFESNRAYQETEKWKKMFYDLFDKQSSVSTDPKVIVTTPDTGKMEG